MTLSTIAIAVVVIVLVLARRVRGEAVPAPKKLFLLPLALGFFGLDDVIHTRLNSIDLAVVIAGSVLSLGLGMLRGRLDRVTVVDGSPWVRWSAASVALFAVNVLAKLALDAGGVAAGGTTAALSNSLLLSLGLAFLGEAAVVWLRTQPETGRIAPMAGRYRGSVQPSGRPTIWPPIR
jgi:hypothetical protein